MIEKLAELFGSLFWLVICATVGSLIGLLVYGKVGAAIGAIIGLVVAALSSTWTLRIIIALVILVAVLLFLFKEDWRRQLVDRVTDWREIKRMLRRFWQWLRETGSSAWRRLTLFVGFLRRQWPKIVGGFLGAIALLVALWQFLKRTPSQIREKLEGPFVYFSFPLISFLARHGIFFFVMEEGTMAITVRGAKVVEGPKTGEPITKGAFSRAYIQWEDHTLSQKPGYHKDDEEEISIDKWDVVEDGTVVYDEITTDGRAVNGEVQRESHHPFGAIRFYLWPLEKVYRYEFQWTNVDVDGNVYPHEPEVLDYIFAREDLYFGEIFEAETADLLQTYVSFLVRARVVNPRKALFEIENWLEAVLNRVRTLVRGYIAQKRYEELHGQRTEASGKVWEKLEDTGRIREFREEYGVEIPDGGIDFLEIEPPEEWRETTLIGFREEQERKGVQTEAAAERDRIETLGWKGLVGRILDRIGGS